jgi:hypothetical protein
MKTDITTEHFSELIKKSYSMDMVFLLAFIQQGIDPKPLCDDSAKINAIYTSLIRKGFITEDNKLTVLGLDILDFISKKTTTKFVKQKPIQSDFDAWWTDFPSTDFFTIANKKFMGSRALRTNKQKCKLEFDKIVGEGEYTVNDIINATKFDVSQRKIGSFKKGTNQITFMQNSLTYLNQRSFEAFIELSKKSVAEDFVERKITGSFDI